MRRKAVIAIAVVLALVAGAVVLGGVSNDAGDGADAPEQAPTGGDGAGGAGMEADAAPDGGDGDRQVERSAESFEDAEDARARRELIRTGTVELRVEDFDRTVDDLSALADARGGYVAESSRRVHTRGNESYVAGAIVLRVPGEEFRPVYEAVQEEGEVRSASSSTEDVTDQLVDIEARLENLRAERERLRALYDEAEETREVLAVQDELAAVQEEIERLEARQRSLEDRVAMATITVELAEPEP